MGIENIALILLPLEFYILYRAQRELFWHFERLTGRAWITYLLVMPSTVAHELAHAVMALILGVPFGRRVRMPNGRRGKVVLFNPERDEETGSVQLGYVTVAQVDPLRNTFISIAPVILVPVFFWLLTWGLLGSGNPIDAIDNLRSLPIWRVVIWGFVAVLLPLAAFPSIGDHISVLGALSLILFTGLCASYLWKEGGAESILGFLTGWSNLLLVPAIIAAIVLVLVRNRR